jgi:hypothetical protein
LWFATSAIAVFIAAGFTAPAGAADGKVTYGDVRAHFEAFEGGGAVVFFKAGPPAADVAASANLFEHSIRPFPGSAWDGASFCDTDWHLLVLAISVAGLEGEPKVTREEGVAMLEPTSVDLYLDGALLTDTERTPIKRLVQSLALLDDGTIVEVFDGWWFQTGAFFGPGELAVGQHTFSATVTDPEFGVFVGEPITFHIDAAGTGSCVY